MMIIVGACYYTLVEYCQVPKFSPIDNKVQKVFINSIQGNQEQLKDLRQRLDSGVRKGRDYTHFIKWLEIPYTTTELLASAPSNPILKAHQIACKINILFNLHVTFSGVMNHYPAEMDYLLNFMSMTWEIYARYQLILWIATNPALCVLYAPALMLYTCRLLEELSNISQGGMLLPVIPVLSADGKTYSLNRSLKGGIIEFIKSPHRILINAKQGYHSCKAFIKELPKVQLDLTSLNQKYRITATLGSLKTCFIQRFRRA